MQDKSTLIHCEHVSNRSFDAAVAAFEAVVGITDDESFQSAVRASASADDFECRMRAFEGSSGFHVLHADISWRVDVQDRADRAG